MTVSQTNSRFCLETYEELSTGYRYRCGNFLPLSGECRSERLWQHNHRLRSEFGHVTATCETDFDGALDGNYEAQVVCTVTDQNGTQIANGDAADIDDVGYAQVVLTFSGTPGSTYTARGIHHAIAVLVEQQFLKTVYEGPYNFSSFESGGGEIYPNYYDWYGPGPEEETNIASMRVGETEDETSDPSLVCSPSPVTRGNTVTCTASAAGVSFSDWQFTDGTNTVTSANGSTATTWSGIAVTSGTVTVTATNPDSSTTTVSAPLTVNARSGWAFTAQSPIRQAQGYSCSGLSVPNPHQPLPAPIGLSCLAVGYSDGTNASTVSDGGPNNGYLYATSIVDGTTYNWTTAQDADTPSSTFYQAQCGNYNSTT